MSNLYTLYTGASYFVVRFHCDDIICTVPRKKILDPQSLLLKVGQTCQVEWRDKKETSKLDATVLGMGELPIYFVAIGVVHVHVPMHYIV